MEGNFAELVDGAAQQLGLNDYQLSAAIGLLEGNRVYSPKQVHRLRTGQVRHPDPEIVERLIKVLRLPEDETWYAAGLWPPDLDIEGYRRYRQHSLAAAGTNPDALKHWLGNPQGQVNGLGQLIPFPVGRRAA